MTPTPKFKDWHQVLAAVITILGGIAIMWMQANRAIDENQRLLREFTVAVHDSETFRETIMQPLEGRWSYNLTWEEYFNQASNDGSGNQLFVSEGIADFRWFGSIYQILLGYENRDDNSGEVYAVGVSTGDLITPSHGVPDIGSVLEFTYVHRKSIGVVGEGEDAIDYDKVPEKKYRLTIEKLQRNSEGRIMKIFCRFDVPISKGNVVFSRRS